MSARSLTLLVLIGLLALPSAASAATKNAITPTSPKAGKTVRVGKRPTLKGRVAGPGAMFVHVCKNKKKNAEGIICSNPSKAKAIQSVKRKNGKFSVKMKFFNFPEFWLNSPGTYYWQVLRVDCSGGSDCNKEGPIVKIKVG